MAQRKPAAKGQTLGTPKEVRTTWKDHRNAETDRRELARLIMEAALEKVAALGFVPLLRERDALDHHTGRHHLKASRLEYVWIKPLGP